MLFPLQTVGFGSQNKTKSGGTAPYFAPYFLQVYADAFLLSAEEETFEIIKIVDFKAKI